jgi:hypothetical protein
MIVQRQVVWPECLGQQPTQRQAARGGVDQAVGTTVLPEQLTTAATRHEHRPACIHTSKCDEPTTSSRV